VNAVLDAIVERMHHDGRFTDRTPTAGRPQQLAEGLHEMAHRASGTRPDQPAVHPDIVVLVPLERLTEPAPDPFAPPAELVGTGPVSIDDVSPPRRPRFLSTMTIDADGRPLNLARRQRLATSEQWIALRARDRGCVAPGCDRKAGWCQAHHLAWWDRDGGATDLANLTVNRPSEALVLVA